MLERMGEGHKRKVYSLGNKYVLKIAKFNKKKFFYFFKKYGFRKALENATGILENLNELKNSKITDCIADVKFSIFGVLNIQKKYDKLPENIDFNNINDIYKVFKQKLLNQNIGLKEIFGKKSKELTKKQQNLRIEYSDLFHMFDVKSNYGIDEKGNIILLDGGNNLYARLLEEYGEKIFDILFIKN